LPFVSLLSLCVWCGIIEGESHVWIDEDEDVCDIPSLPHTLGLGPGMARREDGQTALSAPDGAKFIWALWHATCRANPRPCRHWLTSEPSGEVRKGGGLVVEYYQGEGKRGKRERKETIGMAEIHGRVTPSSCGVSGGVGCGLGIRW
jgi:hypothetical protein